MSQTHLKQRITEAMKAAMRARDKARLGTVRLALAEIKKVEIDERIDLDDSRITSILDKMVKQRRDSIKQFETAGRTDLVAQEQLEINVIKEFLPEALSEEELDTIIKDALEKSGASSMQDMGNLMGLVKPQVVGRADMGAVSQKIKAALS
ncbi:MAG: GatB/YqeY domain-containing protein [Pseudomonadales bacterium]|nr:glutamyl-tRNA amidotransferase [Gammaproteobacteria bacterium]MCH2345061.1 GatB/YqeY domain-containing protein [Pseudomonadales bacterium]HAC86795.1 glutamyl-tRNA amidotransferase [Gammaproteobacteria bacterium]|tara:strand:+ start:1325 stop:1777 length:453 start_codon:yes stop_codon:yes gene_type:complete